MRAMLMVVALLTACAMGAWANTVELSGRVFLARPAAALAPAADAIVRATRLTTYTQGREQPISDEVYEVATNAEGRYALHLPAGSYTVTARLGDDTADALVMVLESSTTHHFVVAPATP